MHGRGAGRAARSRRIVHGISLIRNTNTQYLHPSAPSPSSEAGVALARVNDVLVFCVFQAARAR
jgi:hypothetical protein